jgi:hypothetical protein
LICGHLKAFENCLALNMDFVKNLVVQGNHMLGVLANFICHVILEVLE